MSNTYYLKVQAIQFDGSNQEEIANSLPEITIRDHPGHYCLDYQGCYITELYPGDWIMIAMEEAYVLSDEEFKELCTKPITH